MRRTHVPDVFVDDKTPKIVPNRLQSTLAIPHESATLSFNSETKLAPRLSALIAENIVAGSDFARMQLLCIRVLTSANRVGVCARCRTLRTKFITIAEAYCHRMRFLYPWMCAASQGLFCRGFRRNRRKRSSLQAGGVQHCIHHRLVHGIESSYAERIDYSEAGHPANLAHTFRCHLWTI